MKILNTAIHLERLGKFLVFQSCFLKHLQITQKNFQFIHTYQWLTDSQPTGVDFVTKTFCLSIPVYMRIRELHYKTK